MNFITMACQTVQSLLVARCPTSAGPCGARASWVERAHAGRMLIGQVTQLRRAHGGDGDGERNLSRELETPR